MYAQRAAYRSKLRIQRTRLIMSLPRPTSVSLYLRVFESCDEKTSSCFRTGLSSSYWLMTNYLVNWRRAIPIYHPTTLRSWRWNFIIRPISTLSSNRNIGQTYARRKKNIIRHANTITFWYTNYCYYFKNIYYYCLTLRYSCGFFNVITRLYVGIFLTHPNISQFLFFFLIYK